LSFGEECLVFQFAIQNYKDKDTKNCDYVLFCMGMKIGLSNWGGTRAEGVPEYGADENIWA
jgi:hypothetical protein